ncbi:MAG TPA: serine hydrolase domain-containing protein, partial [Cytophagales bacterium]|jgi:CubicO group peptidase (beta-lactamase class C family)
VGKPDCNLQPLVKFPLETFAMPKPTSIRPVPALLSVLAVVLFASLAFPQTAGNPPYPPSVEARIERIIQNLQPKGKPEGASGKKSLAAQMTHYKVPGVSIAVINGGKLEWARGFGNRDSSGAAPVDVHTLFQAASLSKPVTALTVMRLREQGRLGLDEDVNGYLQSWKVPAAVDWQPRLTLRQLLTHSAGLTVHGFSGYKKGQSLPTVRQILNGESPANSPAVKVDLLPGTRVRYSGGGTVVVQQVLVDVTGKPFPVLVDEALFGPLQLRRSTFEQPLLGRWGPNVALGHTNKGHAIEGGYHLYPELAAAGLWTTPTDLGTVLLEVQKALRGGSSLLERTTAEEMLQPLPSHVSRSTALGFFLEGPEATKRFRHNGWNEGYVTKFEMYRQGGMGAVVMTNSDAGHALIEELLSAIAAEYQWPDFDPAAYVDVSRQETEQLTGIYADDWNNQYQVRAGDNCLLLQYRHQHAIPLYKRADGGFKSKSLGFIVRFEKNFLILDHEGVKYTYRKK